jgi:RNA polymerase sigma factor (sigma-70 family)
VVDTYEFLIGIPLFGKRALCCISKRGKITVNKKRRAPLNTRTLLLQELKDTTNYKAWAELIENYEGYVESIAECPINGTIYLRPQEIGDVVANVWKNLSAGIEKYDRTKGKFRSWLKTITRRRMLDVLDARKPDDDSIREHTPEGNETGTQTCTTDRIKDPQPTTIEELEDKEWANAVFDLTIRMIKAHHKNISDDQFDILITLRRDGMTVPEVCNIFDKTAQQVYNAQHRLGPLLAEYGEKAIHQLENPSFPPHLVFK